MPETSTEMDRLRNATTAVEELAGTVAARLSPVLSPTAPLSETAAAGDTPASSLASSIRECSEAAERAAGMLGDVLARLEV